MTATVERKALRLCLRMLTQLLIKIQAGPQWGLDENGVQKLTTEVHETLKLLTEEGDE